MIDHVHRLVQCNKSLKKLNRLGFVETSQASQTLQDARPQVIQLKKS